jgi:ribose transport system permease protein
MRNQSTAAVAVKGGKIGAIMRRFLKDYMSIVMFLGLFILAAILSPAFLQVSNIVNIMLQNTIIGMLAIGQTMVILSAGIDLSVGATLALTTIVVALLSPYGIVVSLLAGLLVGLMVGLLNGLLIAKLKMAPFIVTLATMGIARSIAAMLTNGEHVTTDIFRFISTINLGFMPLMVLVWIVLIVLFQYLLKTRTSVRNLLAVGGDEETARLSGINISKTKIFAYGTAGLLSSLGAIFYLARLGHGHYTVGATYNLDSIAAVIIGGTSIFGGKGSFTDTFFGVLILGILANIINLLSISVFLKDAFKGVIILAIILFAVLRRRREMKEKNLA